ncbi:lantibiotic dehydratase [Streptomyces sp. NPDC007983]|uniref:lantibiotic dehydratase n=1 Tax=Streptomyces sp. NPDC007983 TaxID=3364800 RepID=UPI0036E09E07
MSAESEFEAAGIALLRAAALPLPEGIDGTGEESGGPDQGRARCRSGPDSADELWRQVKLLADDEEFMTAVRLASPSLADDVRRVLDGAALKEKKLRRVVVSLAKYRLRMTHRPTPFGFFAGVAMAGVGPSPVLETSGSSQSVSRPDAAWLHAVIESLLATPGIVERTRLVANPLRASRDGRLVLVDAHAADGTHRLAHSLRDSAVARCALEYAASPVAWQELVEHLMNRFPEASAEAVRRAVAQMVRGRFLLSDLIPPPDRTDPLGHVLEHLGGLGHPAADDLHAVQEALAALDAASPSDRGTALTTACARMRVVHPAEDLIQSDLALDTRLVLPSAVGREVERAASALWRTSLVQPGVSELRDYHLNFLERYGTDRLVPVLHLLDEAGGLGLPHGYRLRPAEAVAAQPPHPRAHRRDQALAELLLQATKHGTGEVVLDEVALNALTLGETGRPTPPSMEIAAEVVAESWQSLCSGEFQLLLGAGQGSPRGGATFGRFSPALGDRADDVRNLVRRARESQAEDEVTAAVAYVPRVIRSANVATVPQWLDHRIPLGIGPAATDGVTDMPLDELAVHATLDHLRLVHAPTGTRVRPVSYSMLNPASGHLPDVARFLLDLGYEGREWCAPWNWGAWAAAPALPRVRHGRTVLSPARWLPDRELREAAARRAAPAGAPDVWSGHVERWRSRWDVPRYVLLTRVDNRVAVDLDDPLHLLVFQEEMKQPKGLAVTEWFGGPRASAWFTAPGGAHASEFVFPLLARESSGATRPERLRKRPAPVATGVRPRTHVPGGEWLYAKVYVPGALQPHVLARHLPRLAAPDVLEAAEVDTWFFLRYADPDPHLRLRFHGEPDRLWRVLLPAVRAWGEELRTAGLAGRLVLDTYEPEVERYGGPAAIGHAERAFHTDSAAVLQQLTASPGGGTEPVVAAGLGILAALTPFGTTDEVLGWLSDASVLNLRGEVSRARKRTVADLLDAHGRPAPPDPLAGERWAARDTALGRLRAALPEAEGPDGRAAVALSLAHMHCNRLLGPHRDEELLAHATAREGLAVHLGRRRHGG